MQWRWMHLWSSDFSFSATRVLKVVFFSKMREWLLDEFPGNVAQTFTFPTGRAAMTLLNPTLLFHHQVKLLIFVILDDYDLNHWHSHQPQPFNPKLLNTSPETIDQTNWQFCQNSANLLFKNTFWRVIEVFCQLVIRAWRFEGQWFEFYKWVTQNFYSSERSGLVPRV